MKFFIVLFIASVTAAPPKPTKDASKDSVNVPVTGDSEVSNEKGPSFCLNDFNLEVTKDNCAFFIQEVKGLKVLSGNHICTIMNLIYGCHAKVKVLSKDNRNVVAEGDDFKLFTVQLLVGGQADVPITVKSTRSVIVNAEKKLNEKTARSVGTDLLTYAFETGGEEAAAQNFAKEDPTELLKRTYVHVRNISI